MKKRICKLMVVSVTISLLFSGCKANNQVQPKDIYTSEELENFKEDGLNKSEMQELAEITKEHLDAINDSRVPIADNSALKDEVLGFAMIDDQEPYCFIQDDVQMGFDVELAACIAENIGTDFEILSCNNIEECKIHEKMDCIIFNESETQLNGFAFTEEYLNNGEIYFRIAVKQDNQELLDVINNVLENLEKYGIIAELTSSYAL